jgi:hypothetical protein
VSRWSDLAQWRGPTANQSLGHDECRGLVVHIASGYYEGTIGWEKNPAANVSSHFVSGRDGQLAQLVDSDNTAWTQIEGNGHWLSVECEGFALDDALHATHPGWEKLTAAQIEHCAQLLVRGHQQYGYPLQLAGSPAGYGLGYHSMGAEHGYNWGHLHCPGEPIKAQLPEILARAQQITGGGSAPAGVEETMWQGEVNPGGRATIVCTPWKPSQISFGCDFGMAKLRVAEHVNGKGWQVVDEFVIKSGDLNRHDVPVRADVDRRSVLRVPLTKADGLPDGETDKLDTPVGYLAWLV